MAHKPRVLSIAQPSAPHEKAEATIPSVSKSATRAIAGSQAASIRAWIKYGMTVQQAADVTGLATGEIESILRKG